MVRDRKLLIQNYLRFKMEALCKALIEDPSRFWHFYCYKFLLHNNLRYSFIQFRLGDSCYNPNSFNCLVSTGAGAPVIRSRAFWFLGKAMTSRMLVVRASIIARRSRPRAMPPWGGAPMRSASSKKP